MAYIKIYGQRYKVLETLPYHGVGKPTKVVHCPNTPGGERVAVKEYGKWRFWTVEDRLSPFGKQRNSAEDK